MAEGELRTAFVLASRTPSGPGGESDSRPPSARRRTDGARGAAAWRHRHQEREWFAHIDDRILDIMMSRAQTCRCQTSLEMRAHPRINCHSFHDPTPVCLTIGRPPSFAHRESSDRECLRARASPPFRAHTCLCSEVVLTARALPPSLPNATACSFFVSITISYIALSKIVKTQVHSLTSSAKILGVFRFRRRVGQASLRPPDYEFRKWRR